MSDRQILARLVLFAAAFLACIAGVVFDLNWYFFGVTFLLSVISTILLVRMS